MSEQQNDSVYDQAKDEQPKKKPVITPGRFLFGVLAIAAVGSLIDPRLAQAPTAHPAQAVHAPTAIVRTY